MTAVPFRFWRHASCFALIAAMWAAHAAAEVFIPALMSSSGTTTPSRRGGKHIERFNRPSMAGNPKSSAKKVLSPYLPASMRKKALGMASNKMAAAKFAKGKGKVRDDYKPGPGLGAGGAEPSSTALRMEAALRKENKGKFTRQERQRAMMHRRRAVNEMLGERLSSPKQRHAGRTRWGQFGHEHKAHNPTSVSQINSHLKWQWKGQEGQGGVDEAASRLVQSKAFRKSRRGGGGHHPYTPTHVRAGLHGTDTLASVFRPVDIAAVEDGGGSLAGTDIIPHRHSSRGREMRHRLMGSAREQRRAAAERMRSSLDVPLKDVGDFDAAVPVSPRECSVPSAGGCAAPRAGRGDVVEASHVEEGQRFSAECRDVKWIWKNTNSIKDTHMATLAVVPETDGQHMVAAWQAAPSGEGDGSQTIMISYSRDGGESWGGAKKMGAWKEMYQGALWGPAFFTPPGGSKLLMFFSGSNYCALSARMKSFRPGGDVLVSTTKDGMRWSRPKIILRQRSSKDIPYVTANGPAVAGDGTWALPVWGEFPPKTVCNCTKENEAAFALTTSDNGGKWRKSSPLKDRSTWLIEGTIVPLSGGRLLQLFRTRRGSLYRSVSRNGGKTWEEAQPTKLPNPNSKVHAIVLSNGEVALAYNHHQSRANIDGVRSRLYVATSADEGLTWDVIARLETDTTKGHRYHYPWLLQRGCSLHVAYTVRFRGYSLYGPKGEMAGIKMVTLRLKGRS